jgi:peptidoglycan/xylan/chitin deacetylase (PgdA/CDA1 family)
VKRVSVSIFLAILLSTFFACNSSAVSVEVLSTTEETPKETPKETQKKSQKETPTPIFEVESVKNEERVKIKEDVTPIFEYVSVLDSICYNKKNDDGGFYINVSVPHTVSEKINNALSAWGAAQINFFKEQGDSNGSLEISYDLFKLGDSIINIKFNISEQVFGARKQSVKTFLYDTSAESELLIEATNVALNSELRKVAILAKKAFIEDGLGEKVLVKDNIKEGLDPTYINYESFIINPETKKFKFFFDEDQLGELLSHEVIEVEMPLNLLTRSFSQMIPDIYALFADEFNAEKKFLALTFDDGPGWTSTQNLVEALREYNIKVTFFPIGANIEKNPEAFKTAFNDGHEIGNHTYSHPILTRYSYDNIFYQINHCNEIAEELTGKRPTLLRPPYGEIDDRVKEIAASLGMPVIMWSVDTRDWESQNADSVCRRILNEAQNGSVILLHDWYDTSVEGALKAIPTLIERGYEFVTVSELMRLGGIAEMTPGVKYYYAEIETPNEDVLELPEPFEKDPDKIAGESQ